jgi:hypothetical protein
MQIILLKWFFCLLTPIWPTQSQASDLSLAGVATAVISKLTSAWQSNLYAA